MSERTTQTENEPTGGEGEKPDTQQEGGEGTVANEGVTPDAPAEKAGEDNAGLKSALKAEREARKAHEKELKELRKWREEREREAMTEQDKLQSDLKKAQDEAADATAPWQEATLRNELHAAAVSAGMNPLVVDDVFVAQKALGAIKVEEGSVVGVAESIEALQAAKPLYFSEAKGNPGKINAGSTGGGSNGPQMTSDESTAAAWFKGAGVSAEDYLKHKTS